MAFDQKIINPEKTVYLIDGSSLLYRSYYGVRPLHTSKGVAVQAVYNFCRTIKKMAEQFGMQYLGIVWDSKGKTTRHEMYSDYKATRQAPPADIFDQKELICEFADLMGIKQIVQSGVEADDLLFSVAKEQVARGMNVVFVTLDKDMRQALSEHVFIYDPMKDLFIDAATAEALAGVPIEKLPFYFALIGDSSDNIPGVKGIGPKMAQDLVAQFDSLDDMYAHIHSVDRARIRNLLEEQKENAYLSYHLFLLQDHACGTKPADFKFHIERWKEAQPLFAQLEFKTFLKELDGAQTKDVTQTGSVLDYWKSLHFKTVTTEQDLDQLCAVLKDKKIFACDTETTNGKPLESSCVGISFATDEQSVWYVPFRHNVQGEQLSRDQVMGVLAPILQNKEYGVVMHHAKFDMLVFHHEGVPVAHLAFDTLIAARLLLPEWQKISLKSLSAEVLDEQMLSFEDVAPKGQVPDFSYVPLDLATAYSGADSRQTWKLYKYFQKQLHEQGLFELYQTVELPLVSLLCEMEQEGIILDAAVLAEIGVRVSAQIIAAEEDICAAAGLLAGSINLNSPRQIEHLLFTLLQLPPQKKLVKGEGYSTDSEVLSKLRLMHPVVDSLIKYRELSKLKNTYIDALPTYVNPNTGRIHTSFSQTIVATGRLSSSEPNLQNIPASGTGLEIRAAFKPKPGHCFISADYSQIELRVLAQLAQEKTLIKAFVGGHDVHAETAALLFDVAVQDVTHEQRQLGKRINFSVLYGLTPYGLSRELSISMADAKRYIEKYHAQYPQIFAWMEEVVAFAKKHGFVQTFWKRRRYVPGIYEKNKTMYEEARRVAINTVAQGTAADIMKQGMLAVSRAFFAQKIDAQIVLQIHDELLISVCEQQKEQAEQLVKQVLESVVAWQVPLTVTTRVGHNWLEVSK